MIQNSTLRSKIKNTQQFLLQVEGGILVGLLTITIVLAVLQIILRTVFSSGIVWSDALVRILVLWLGLLGAMYASRSGNHIKIDLASRYFPPNLKRYTNCIVDLFSAGICTIVAISSIRLIVIEYQDGVAAFANVPVWLCESIIPISFIVMAWRYFLSALVILHEPSRQ